MSIGCNRLVVHGNRGCGSATASDGAVSLSLFLACWRFFFDWQAKYIIHTQEVMKSCTYVVHLLFFLSFSLSEREKKREWSTYSPAQQFLKRTCRPFYINRRREKRDKKQPSLMRPVYMRLFRRPALSSSSSFQHLNLFYSFFFFEFFRFSLCAPVFCRWDQSYRKENKTKQNKIYSQTPHRIWIDMFRRNVLRVMKCVNLPGMPTLATRHPVLSKERYLI